jgi:hypothetical protein
VHRTNTPSSTLVPHVDQIDLVRDACAAGLEPLDEGGRCGRVCSVFHDIVQCDCRRV